MPPPYVWRFLSQAEYDALVAADEVMRDWVYFITIPNAEYYASLEATPEAAQPW